jgi:hypothetical protein
VTGVPTRTLWRVVDAQWHDNEPDVSVISIMLQANGNTYAVVCSGPKGMKSDEFTSAIQAAATTLIRANGGSIAVGDPDTTFDTGDQRAN